MLPPNFLEKTAPADNVCSNWLQTQYAHRPDFHLVRTGAPRNRRQRRVADLAADPGIDSTRPPGHGLRRRWLGSRWRTRGDDGGALWRPRVTGRLAALRMGEPLPGCRTIGTVRPAPQSRVSLGNSASIVVARTIGPHHAHRAR